MVSFTLASRRPLRELVARVHKVFQISGEPFEPRVYAHNADQKMAHQNSWGQPMIVWETERENQSGKDAAVHFRYRRIPTTPV